MQAQAWPRASGHPQSGWPPGKKAYVGSPALGGNPLYLQWLTGGQTLQVALDLDQEGIQHVQDPKEQGSV